MSRFHYLDALRSGAMLVVVAWHLTLLWPVAVPLSDSTGEALDWLMPLTRWSLPLFFLMGGFFGAALTARWGPLGFMRDRVIRVGIPLAIGLVTIIPLTKLVMREALPELGLLGLLKGPMHLWFLWYLLVFYAAWVAVSGTEAVAKVSRALTARIGSPFAPIVLALLSAALIAARRQAPRPAGPWDVPPP